MSGENEGVVIVGETGSHDASPQRVSEAIHKKASDLGWRPLEEFKGDPADWVDAKEFLGRQSLFEKIASQRNEIQSMKRDLTLVREYVQQMSKIEYDRALKQLKADRKAAIADADVETAEQLDKDIESLQENRKASPASDPNQGQNEEVARQFEAWQNRNEWYKTDPELRQQADAIGIGYGTQNRGIAPDALFAYVEKTIKKMYPEKFGTPTTRKSSVADTSSPVESGGITNSAASPRQSKGNKITEADLTSDQLRIMNALVRTKTVTKEQYLAQLSDAEQNVHRSFSDYDAKEKK